MTINIAMLSNAKALNWTYGLYCTLICRAQKNVWTMEQHVLSVLVKALVDAVPRP